jgi:uncharacterized OB-fold protein
MSLPMSNTDALWQTLPEKTDANAPFWDAASEGRLLLRSSRQTGAVWCGVALFDPVDAEWFEASGDGSILRSAIDQSDVKAEIQLVEGGRITTQIIGPGALDARIGDAVRCVYAAAGNGCNVPQFVREVSCPRQ